jgi:hypothetical protein
MITKEEFLETIERITIEDIATADQERDRLIYTTPPEIFVGVIEDISIRNDLRAYSAYMLAKRNYFTAILYLRKPERFHNTKLVRIALDEAIAEMEEDADDLMAHHTSEKS